MKPSRRICVFCGASAGRSSAFADAAMLTGRAIAARGYGMVYGGGRIGLMGILADAALAADGEVIGVIPASLASSEIAHHGVTKLHIVDSMHERKALMANLSDAFIALPGGYGTMDEFCEMLTWKQLGIHDKPIGLLNVDGYFDSLIALFDRMVDEGFVSHRNRDIFTCGSTIEELLERLDLSRT